MRSVRTSPRADRKEEHREKQAAREHWTAAGGSEEDFETAWPEMWRQALATRTLEAQAQAHRQAFHRTREVF